MTQNNPILWASIVNSPTFKAGMLLALFTSLVWGIFIEVTNALDITYLFTWHLRNNVALLTYSLTALLSVLFSSSILYKGYTNQYWTPIEALVFYAGLLMALLLLSAGFEFIVYGEWQLRNSAWLGWLKNALIIFFTLLLIRLWILEKRFVDAQKLNQNSDHSS